MTQEHYFTKNIEPNTWEDFIMHYQARTTHRNYRLITGYGWKDTFGYNCNGEALYIDEHGYKYKGIWFEIGEKRISIFESNIKPSKKLNNIDNRDFIIDDNLPWNNEAYKPANLNFEGKI